MTNRVFQSAAVAAFLVGGTATAAPPQAQAQDCRSIADPARRLACYDNVGSRAPAAPAPSQAVPRQALPSQTMTAGPAPAATSRSGSSEGYATGFRSQIVAVAPLRYGFELRLADGSVWSTTSTGGVNPKVGDSIRYRTSLLGAKYFDIPGRAPLAVRRES